MRGAHENKAGTTKNPKGNPFTCQEFANKDIPSSTGIERPFAWEVRNLITGNGNKRCKKMDATHSF